MWRGKINKKELDMCSYDVFICCKSEDYDLAWDVYLFLVKNEIRVFLADAELRKKGEAEYGKIIDEALESVQHLILITSKKEYVGTSYVESEWRTFLEEKRCGRKTGNIITILKNVNLSELPISLRRQQSFLYEDFKDVINYLPLNGKYEGKMSVNEDNVHNVSDNSSKNNKKWYNINNRISIVALTIIAFLCGILYDKKQKIKQEYHPDETNEVKISVDVPDHLRINVERNDIQISDKLNNSISINAIINNYTKVKGKMSPEHFTDKLIETHPSMELSKQEILNLIYSL